MLVGQVCIRMGLGDERHQHRRRRRQLQPKQGLSGSKEVDRILDNCGNKDWGFIDNLERVMVTLLN